MWLSQSGEWKSDDSDDSDYEISDEEKPKKSKRPKIEKKTRPRRRKGVLFLERSQKKYYTEVCLVGRRSSKTILPKNHFFLFKRRKMSLKKMKRTNRQSGQIFPKLFCSEFLDTASDKRKIFWF